jgi:hypothetical protein
VVESTAQPAGKSPTGGGSLDAPVAQAINQLIDLRRKVQELEQSGALLRIRNELIRTRQAERQRRAREKKSQRAERFVFSSVHRRADQQRQMLTRVEQLGRDVSALEEGTLMEFYGAQPVNTSFVAAARDDVYAQLQTLLFDLYRDSGDHTNTLTVAIFGSSLDFVCQMAAAYMRLCEKEGDGVVRRHWLKIYREELDIYKDHDDAAVKRPTRTAPPGVELPVLHLKSSKTSETDVPRKVVDVYAMKEASQGAPPSDAIGIALQVTGPRAMALLETESGKHDLERNRVRKATCHVETTPAPLVKYDPPADAGRVGAFRDQRERRTYDATAQICRDQLLKQDFLMPGGEIDAAIHDATRSYLTQRIWELIDTWN